MGSWKSKGESGCVKIMEGNRGRQDETLDCMKVVVCHQVTGWLAVRRPRTGQKEYDPNRMGGVG